MPWWLSVNISGAFFYKSKGVSEWQPHPNQDLDNNYFHYSHHRIIQTKISGSPGTFWQTWFFCEKHWLVWHTHTHINTNTAQCSCPNWHFIKSVNPAEEKLKHELVRSRTWMTKPSCSSGLSEICGRIFLRDNIYLPFRRSSVHKKVVYADDETPKHRLSSTMSSGEDRKPPTDHKPAPQ